jgi:hypothetical protein
VRRDAGVGTNLPKAHAEQWSTRDEREFLQHAIREGYPTATIQSLRDCVIDAYTFTATAMGPEVESAFHSQFAGQLTQHQRDDRAVVQERPRVTPATGYRLWITCPCGVTFERWGLPQRRRREFRGLGSAELTRHAFHV